MVFSNCDFILLISASKHLTGCEEIAVGLGLPENSVNNAQERKILYELIKTVQCTTVGQQMVI